ncbi:MAG: hypothetical protein DMF86_24130 [Acidobacteria bacterium]|nr:MAG: hypothetical protein DMF86_24130 [Acidobacteriota bacterium]
MPLRYSPLGLVLLIAVSGVVEQTSESVQVCLASAADYSAVYPTNVLPATSKGIAVVFRVTKGKYKKLTEKIFAVDAGTAIPPNALLASTDDVVGPVNGVGFFESSGERPVPPGKYRVDILADDAPWKTAQFSVVPAAEPKITRPEDLVVLPKGRVWTYAETVEAGGTRMTHNDTYAIASVDNAGARVDASSEHMLWHLGPSGLAVWRKELISQALLPQPQVWLSWPLNAPKTWSYPASDGSFTETYRMWGPVPVKGLQGEAPGYVVLTDRQIAREDFHSTTERDFLPGVGIVREIYVVATKNGELQSRVERMLTSVR